MTYISLEARRAARYAVGDVKLMHGKVRESLSGTEMAAVVDAVIQAILPQLTPQPVFVPAEWKLVPIEPDEAQIYAMRLAFRDTHRPGISGMTIDAQYRAENSRELAAYRAMLESAPQPFIASTGLSHLQWGKIDFAANIKRVIEDESSSGAACSWKPCSGCHETIDGQETGDYPFSEVFGCHVGAGCTDCGGLGVVWGYWAAKDLEDMAKDDRIKSVTPESISLPLEEETEESEEATELRYLEQCEEIDRRRHSDLEPDY